MTLFLEISNVALLVLVGWRILAVEKRISRIEEFLGKGSMQSISIDPEALERVVQSRMDERRGHTLTT